MSDTEQLENEGVTACAICVECGKAIPSARLLAVPGCCRCAHCQSDFEAECLRAAAR